VFDRGTRGVEFSPWDTKENAWNTVGSHFNGNNSGSSGGVDLDSEPKDLILGH